VAQFQVTLSGRFSVTPDTRRDGNIPWVTIHLHQSRNTPRENKLRPTLPIQLIMSRQATKAKLAANKKK